MKAKFILSKQRVKKQIEQCNTLSNEVSYSFKTNYEVGKILEETTNCWFSVHSLESVKDIKNKEKIWFFAQGWDNKEIIELLEEGVTSFVVDNSQDLEILLDHIKTTEKDINVLLRMRLKEQTVQTGKHFVFGFYSKKINELIPLLKKNKRIGKLGIHFHRKTQNVTEWSLKEELEDSLDATTLDKMDVINIGGGIPSFYKNYQVKNQEAIFSEIIKVKEWLNKKDIKMILEPGRFIAAPAIKLVTEIKNIYEKNIIVNASVYNSAMDTFVANLRLLVEDETTEGEGYTIKGITPDSLDIYRYKVYFKKKPKVGDQITFLNAGAYNFRTDFCKLPKIQTEVIE